MARVDSCLNLPLDVRPILHRSVPTGLDGFVVDLVAERVPDHGIDVKAGGYACQDEQRLRLLEVVDAGKDEVDEVKD